MVAPSKHVLHAPTVIHVLQGYHPSCHMLLHHWRLWSSCSAELRMELQTWGVCRALILIARTLMPVAGLKALHVAPPRCSFLVHLKGSVRGKVAYKYQAGLVFEP